MKRRSYLVGSSLALTTVLSGCTGSDDGMGETNETDDDESTSGTDGGNNDTGTDGEVDPIVESAGTFDDFEDTDPWTVLDGSAYVAADQSYIGSQSIRLETNGDEGSPTISRTFDTLRDFSGLVPGLAMESDQQINPVIQLKTVDDDRIDFRCVNEPGVSFQRYPFGIHRVVGEPDLSMVSAIRILTWAGNDTSLSFLIDDLHFVEKPETGSVLLQFDREYDSVGDVAWPVLAEYNYPATVFAETNRVGGGGRLDVDDLHDLQDDGWTIASLGAYGRDLTQLSMNERQAELGDAVEWLTEQGFDGAGYFAYPYARYNQHVLNDTMARYDLVFADGFPAQGYVSNTGNYGRVIDTDVDGLIERIDQTAEYGGITPLYFNDVAGDAQMLETVISHIHDLESAGGLDVIVPEDLEANYVH